MKCETEFESKYPEVGLPMRVNIELVKMRGLSITGVCSITSLLGMLSAVVLVLARAPDTAVLLAGLVAGLGLLLGVIGVGTTLIAQSGATALNHGAQTATKARKRLRKRARRAFLAESPPKQMRE